MVRAMGEGVAVNHQQGSTRERALTNPRGTPSPSRPLADPMGRSLRFWRRMIAGALQSADVAIDAGVLQARNSAEYGRDAGRRRVPNGSACSPKTCTLILSDEAREWHRPNPAKEGADRRRGSRAAAGRQDPVTSSGRWLGLLHNVVIACQHDGRSSRVEFRGVGGQALH